MWIFLIRNGRRATPLPISLLWGMRFFCRADFFWTSAGRILPSSTFALRSAEFARRETHAEGALPQELAD